MHGKRIQDTEPGPGPLQQCLSNLLCHRNRYYGYENWTTSIKVNLFPADLADLRGECGIFSRRFAQKYAAFFPADLADLRRSIRHFFLHTPRVPEMASPTSAFYCFFSTPIKIGVGYFIVSSSA